ncbi:MAG TPA: flagellar hook-associated protein FlgL [Tepidiformaceae bacterium]|nr:flagellar hook-associated protein FlgL [Tepidiformaceae bacterium]
MTLRVSAQSQITNQISYLQTAQSQMDKVQEQLSTNRKINQASDDPQGAALALGYRQQIAFEAQMRRNIDGGVSFLNASDAALSSANDALQRVRELAVQGANGTNSQQGRDAMGVEVDQLLQEMVQIGNSNFNGTYLFAGNKTDAPPFTTTSVNGQITGVAYAGDQGQRIRQISQQSSAAVNVTGTTAFGATFQDLIELRDNLKNNPDLVNGSLSKIDSDLNTVLTARADVGSKTNMLQDVSARSLATDTNLQGLKSGIEEIDVSETVVQLTAKSNQLQAALGAIGKTINMSLLNYIQ